MLMQFEQHAMYSICTEACSPGEYAPDVWHISCEVWHKAYNHIKSQVPVHDVVYTLKAVKTLVVGGSTLKGAKYVVSKRSWSP